MYLFVDPGELKNNSRFIKCKGIRDLEPSSSPGLEEMTGADVLVSPINSPRPANDFLIKMHLDQGALLIQLKFGFDLVASIIDGRFKASQAKMLATGASQNQIVLLFIGLVFEPEKENSELMINGTYARNVVPAAKNFKYKHCLEHRLKWSLRGGIFEQITLESSLATWIKSAAKMFNEPVNKQVWEPQQRLFLTDDWRNILVNLPGLGEKKAQDIYDWLPANKSFYGFLAALEDGSLVEVSGIGPGTIEKIKNYLKGM